MPISKHTIIKGVNIPNNGQNAIMNNIIQTILRKVEMGIRLGQYISHGIVIFCTNGNHSVKYNMIVVEARKQTNAELK